MTKNPFYNALAALIYIVVIVTVLFNLSHITGGEDENMLFPIAGLSLLVLSVAFMAYTFFYQPVVMLLDGKRDEAAKLFIRTLAIFACGTATVFTISLFVQI